MENTERIQIREAVLANFIHLYQMFHERDGWPAEIDSLAKVRDWFASWQTMNWMNCGELQLLYDTEQHAFVGFTILSEIQPSFCPNSLKVMEGGTYLVPLARGRGINAIAKRSLFQRAQQVYLADAVVFTIPSDNLRALTAIRKYEVQEITDETDCGIWNKLLRRKKFETGSQNLHIFVSHIE